MTPTPPTLATACSRAGRRARTREPHRGVARLQILLRCSRFVCETANIRLSSVQNRGTSEVTCTSQTGSRCPDQAPRLEPQMETPRPALAGQCEAPSGPMALSPPPAASQATGAVSGDGAPRRHPTRRRGVGLERSRATQLHLRPAGVSALLNLGASTRDPGRCHSQNAGSVSSSNVTRNLFSSCELSKLSRRVITGDGGQVFALRLAQCPALCLRNLTGEQRAGSHPGAGGSSPCPHCTCPPTRLLP